MVARVHTHVPPASPEHPYTIPTEFDPNLALAIIWGKDLAEVSAHGLAFLDTLRLEGHDGKGEPLKSNVEFLKKKNGAHAAFLVSCSGQEGIYFYDGMGKSNCISFPTDCVISRISSPASTRRTSRFLRPVSARPVASSNPARPKRRRPK